MSARLKESATGSLTLLGGTQISPDATVPSGDGTDLAGFVLAEQVAIVLGVTGVPSDNMQFCRRRWHRAFAPLAVLAGFALRIHVPATPVGLEILRPSSFCSTECSATSSRLPAGVELV